METDTYNLREKNLSIPNINGKKTSAEVYRDSVSITHRHILAVLNTILKHENIFKGQKQIRILDAGCGSGKMIYFLNKYLPLFNVNKQFFIYGFDVLDH